MFFVVFVLLLSLLFLHLFVQGKCQTVLCLVVVLTIATCFVLVFYDIYDS